MAELKDSVARHANFTCADLAQVDLRGAKLHLANFEQTNVHGARGLLFNNNRVEGIHIGGRAQDPWSELRRKYTGPWFFVHLALLAVFFAPFIANASYLTGKSWLQQWSVQEYHALDNRLPELAPIRTYQRELERRFLETHEDRLAVWTLLGLNRGTFPLTLAALVILYNAIRGYLTLRVSTLRDAEERSSSTPKLEEYYGSCPPCERDVRVEAKHVLRIWWTSHFRKVETHSRPGQQFRHCLAFPRWLPVPKWAERRWDAVYVLSRLGPPRSLVDWLGLYRLHCVASVLLVFALVAVLYNTALWVVETRLWVPIAP